MPELSYREAVRDALSQAMRDDEGVFVMGEDIAEMGGSMGVTAGMLDEFGPERIRNTPISEIAIVGAGIGAAMQGMRPVVEVMYEDFLTVSMEQIVNQAAKHRYMSGGQLKVPLTIRTQGGAGWSPAPGHACQGRARGMTSHNQRAGPSGGAHCEFVRPDRDHFQSAQHGQRSRVGRGASPGGRGLGGRPERAWSGGEVAVHHGGCPDQVAPAVPDNSIEAVY